MIPLGFAGMGLPIIRHCRVTRANGRPSDITGYATFAWGTQSVNRDSSLQVHHQSVGIASPPLRVIAARTVAGSVS